MKKTGKKILSVVLSVMFVLLIVTPVLSTAYAEKAKCTTPVIYVEGQGSTLYEYPNTSQERKIYPIDIPEGYIEEMVKKYLPVFVKAVITQEWDDFCDALYDIMVPLFKDIKLNPQGEPYTPSGTKWTWSRETLKNKYKDGSGELMAYTFKYDWRIDPMETAVKLRKYIEDVRYVTGSDKVALVGRCLGASITSAYMTMYDGEYVETCVVYCGAQSGAITCGKPFSGDLWLNADAINRYVNDIELSEDPNINDLICAFVALANKTYGLDLAAAAVNNVYPKIYLKINPRILRETYGSFPAYWSMVGEEDYQKAKETVFYGADMDEWSEFVDKIDNYHYNVQQKLPETIKRQETNGIKWAFISKYGYQTVPVTLKSDEISDGVVTLKESTIGATTSKVDKTFSKLYLFKAKLKGTDKYISPDLQVDASTCLVPERTWIIKNIKHKVFPESVDHLIAAIINSHGEMTVFDDPQFTQYLVYDDETKELSPMTQENMDTTQRWNMTFFEALVKLFKAVGAIIKNKLPLEQIV